MTIAAYNFCRRLSFLDNLCIFSLIARRSFTSTTAFTLTLREDILGEKVMSAILEIKTTVDRTEEIILLVREVEKQLDTVVCIGVGTRCDENGDENVVAPILERLGYKLERAKTNIGLGKVTNTSDESHKKEEPVPAMS